MATSNALIATGQPSKLSIKTRMLMGVAGIALIYLGIKGAKYAWYAWKYGKYIM